MSSAALWSAWNPAGAGLPSGGWCWSAPSAASCSTPLACSIFPCWRPRWRGCRGNKCLSKKGILMNTKRITLHWEVAPAGPGTAVAEETIPTVLPVDMPADRGLVETEEASALGLVELLLKDPARLDQ